jgi:hypothetical protein
MTAQLTTLPCLNTVKNYIGKLYYPIAITITHKIYGLSKDRFFALAVSLTLLRPKLAISKLNIFANSTPYAKRL